MFLESCLATAFSHVRMERARQLNLVPGDILFRKVFCYTRKDGDCWVHCVARVPVHLPLFVVGNQPSDAKNSLVSLTTVPESSSNASRFGMLIRPLKVSAMLHSRPRSTVAPRMDTKE